MAGTMALLPWTAGGGRLDGIVALIRAARAGIPVAWRPDGLAIDGTAGERLARRLDLPLTAPGEPKQSFPIVPPRVVLFAGPSAGYPYAAYYAHCLWSLGLTFTAADAAGLAAGALDAADLLIVPGGFAIWGLDCAEEVCGADAAVRRFLDRGGAAIGSCGGAFYFSAGRPGWQAAAGMKPKYTHEYLLTGAGVVNVRLDDAVIRTGVPDELEMPYYHGPVWPETADNARALASFTGFACPSRLFIDNPLDRGRLERDMAGR